MNGDGAKCYYSCTVGFHNFNLLIFNLRVSNPSEIIVVVFLTRCRISMCQRLGQKKHDEISEIDRMWSANVFCCIVSHGYDIGGHVQISWFQQLSYFPLYELKYGRFPKFHRAFLGRDPGTLKSDIVSKKHPQSIYSDLRLSN